MAVVPRPVPRVQTLTSATLASAQDPHTYRLTPEQDNKRRLLEPSGRRGSEPGRPQDAAQCEPDPWMAAQGDFGIRTDTPEALDAARRGKHLYFGPAMMSCTVPASWHPVGRAV